MNTEKLMDAVRRQSELAQKAANNGLTDEEKKELEQIAQWIAAMNGEHEPQCKVELVVMNGEEFKEYVESESTTSNLDRLSVLRRNMHEVERQAKLGKDAFAVLMPVEKTAEEENANALEEINKRMDKMESILAEIASQLVKTEEQDSEEEKPEEPAAEEEKAEDEKPAEEKPAEEKPEDEKPEDEKPAEEPEAEEKPDEEEAKKADEPRSINWEIDLTKGIGPKDEDDAYRLMKGACENNR